jgi:hypothetical protein
VKKKRTRSLPLDKALAAMPDAATRLLVVAEILPECRAILAAAQIDADAAWWAVEYAALCLAKKARYSHVGGGDDPWYSEIDAEIRSFGSKKWERTRALVDRAIVDHQRPGF